MRRSILLATAGALVSLFAEARAETSLLVLSETPLSEAELMAARGGFRAGGLTFTIGVTVSPIQPAAPNIAAPVAPNIAPPRAPTPPTLVQTTPAGGVSIGSAVAPVLTVTPAATGGASIAVAGPTTLTPSTTIVLATTPLPAATAGVVENVLVATGAPAAASGSAPASAGPAATPPVTPGGQTIALTFSQATGIAVQPTAVGADIASVVINNSEDGAIFARTVTIDIGVSNFESAAALVQAGSIAASAISNAALLGGLN
jgi:hypothetical protein